jgi:hypothetical protein
MRLKLIVLLVLSYFALSSYGQETQRSIIALQLGMNRLDFQSGIVYGHSWGRMQAIGSFEVGINRSIFQGRMFPRLTIGGAYKLVSKNNFCLGPQLTYSHSLLKLNKLSTHFNAWNEIYAGARMEVGSKWRFIFMMAGGWQNERYFNTYLNRKSSVNSLGFNVNIGLAYAW